MCVSTEARERREEHENIEINRKRKQHPGDTLRAIQRCQSTGPHTLASASPACPPADGAARSTALRALATDCTSTLIFCSLRRSVECRVVQKRRVIGNEGDRGRKRFDECAPTE